MLLQRCFASSVAFGIRVTGISTISNRDCLICRGLLSRNDGQVGNAAGMRQHNLSLCVCVCLSLRFRRAEARNNASTLAADIEAVVSHAGRVLLCHLLVSEFMW